MPLIAVADIQSWINDPNGNTNTVVLTALQTRVVKWWETQTGRQLNPQASVTKVLRGTGEISIALPAPVTSGSPTMKERFSVVTDFADVTAIDSALLETVLDEYRNTTIVIRKDRAVWPLGDWLVEATFTTGYADGGAPKDLEQAILETITATWRHRVRVQGVRSQLRTQNGEQVGSDIKMTDFAAATLERYRTNHFRSARRLARA